ncbi:beta-2-microglobulin [Eleutherodactylus coqui]|uniref:beta-2-microglobulin n=1 Tax=Eleutherodactylus coqui TaxID=57060 RepID=UPI0034638051
MRSAALVSGGALLLVVALSQTLAVTDSPTVNVYTQTPVEYGENNRLICYCTGFHPPLIDMTLRKNGEEIQNCEESDLSFQQNWKYYKSKHCKFTPEKGAVYDCAVRHNNGKTLFHGLEIF